MNTQAGMRTWSNRAPVAAAAEKKVESDRDTDRESVA